MDRDVRHSGDDQPLFRSKAQRAAARDALGRVSVALPRFGLLAVAVSLLLGAGLALLGVVVEVPLKITAPGLIMPAGGFVEIDNTIGGRVGAVNAVAGEIVPAGASIAVVDRTAADNEQALLEIAQLRQEQDLLTARFAARQAALAERLSRQRGELQVLEQQLLATEGQVTARRNLEKVQADKLLRLESLAARGFIAKDRLDDEQTRSQVLAVDSENEALQLLQLRREALQLQSVIDDLESEQAVVRADLLLQSGRLATRIRQLRSAARQEVRAPGRLAVARILVREGEDVIPGQAIAKLYRPEDRLQAWLYLPASSARLLQAGQTVVLSLPAYPRERFGIRMAVVTDVSPTVIAPADIDAPLRPPGPVFEVRARLAEEDAGAGPANWTPGPGTSVTADIVQRRFRLYEWIIASVTGQLFGGDA